MPDVLADLCGDYLARLRTALNSVDPNDREQIVAQVAEHLHEALAALPNPGEEALLEILERLGSPEEIAAAAAAPEQSDHRSRRSVVWLAVAAGGLVVALALGIAAIAGGFRSSTPSGSSGTTGVLVVVPNVVGMGPARAAGILQEAGLYNSIDDLSCGRSISRGHTVAESPPPGSRVASATRISIQVACSFE
jgi:HAAS/PASTA domain